MKNDKLQSTKKEKEEGKVRKYDKVNMLWVGYYITFYLVIIVYIFSWTGLKICFGLCSPVNDSIIEGLHKKLMILRPVSSSKVDEFIFISGIVCMNIFIK